MKEREEHVTPDAPAVVAEELLAEEVPPTVEEASAEVETLAVKPARSRKPLLVSVLLLGIGGATWFVMWAPASHDTLLDDYVAKTPTRSLVAELEKAIAASPWLATAALLGVTAALLLAAVVYVVLVGSRSVRRLRQEALGKADRVYGLLNETAPLVTEYEGRMAQRMHAVPAAKMRAFGSLKRILRALEHRLKEVEPYLCSWRLGDVERAHALLNQAFVVEDSVFEWVIDSDEIPPLDFESVSREIDKLRTKLSEERP